MKVKILSCFNYDWWNVYAIVKKITLSILNLVWTKLMVNTIWMVGMRRWWKLIVSIPFKCSDMTMFGDKIKLSFFFHQKIPSKMKFMNKIKKITERAAETIFFFIFYLPSQSFYVAFESSPRKVNLVNHAFPLSRSTGSY